MKTRVWAFVCAARATYLKPLYEGLAGAQPESWKTLLVMPEIAPEDHAHPVELTTPEHPRLQIQEVPVGRKVRQHGTGHQAAHYGTDYFWMPQTRVAEILAAHDVRGVIIHEFSPFTLVALLWARWRGLPVVYFGDVGQANAHCYGWKTRLWHRLWTHAVDARMAGCPAARLTVSGRRLPVCDVFHAVDSTTFQPFPKADASGRPVIFVFSGQLIARKGLDLWFQAAGQLRRSGKGDFRLRVVGGGDDAWAKNCAETSGVADLVEWCGFLQREAMREAIGTADVFVLPSRWDSYAVVTHEAACLGLPLLISRHAGSADALVKEDETGWQIEPEDVVGFARCMEQMLDAQTRLRMGRAARLLGEQLCARRRGAEVWRWLQEMFRLG
ncbi:MAG: glycosyltransferase family 4 protein [Verrucomicrobiota bacterium]